MKKILLILSCISIGLTGVSQTNHQLETLNEEIKFTKKAQTLSSLKQGMSNCLDTLTYSLAKANGLQTISINNATSAQAFSQYYDAPQAISVNGANFYAYSAAGFTVNVEVSLYLAGPDSLPTGAPLTTTIVPVDTNFGAGSLDVLFKQAIFSAPVAISQPYIIVVANNSADNIAAICSDYTAQDGQQEWLSALDIGGNWLHSYEVLVGGSPFDADWLIEPIVTYELTADFTTNKNVITNSPDTIEFTDNSSLVLKNRMYNQAAFVGATNLSYTYDFGDGSQAVNAIDTNHIYTSLQDYSVTLNDTIFGWKNNCVAAESKQITFSTPNLVISEIMYNGPEAGTDTTEFVEIYNNDSVAIPLTNYSFSQGVTYTFPNFTLNPGEYYVVAVDSFAFNTVFGFYPNGEFSGGLSNGGEDVTLVNENGIMIDSVDYENSAPWPTVDNITGTSIILCDVNTDNNVAGNWNSSNAGTGFFINGIEVKASPGAANFCCPILNGTDTQVACDSLTWMDGITYYADNTSATHTIPSSQGCDSVITLNLTINASPTITVTEPAGEMQSANCFGDEFMLLASGANSYVWDDLSSNDTYTYVADTANMWFTLSVTGTDTVTGCSAVGTFNIPGVYDPVSPGNQTLTICDGESIVVGNNTYDATGIYTDTLMSMVNGCDSIVTTDLTVEAAIDNTVDNSMSPVLTANQAGAAYQWLDCDNANAIIPTETGQSFTATANGNYAVEITMGNCVDTSDCVNVTGVGINELRVNSISINPNPTTGNVQLSVNSAESNATLEVLNVVGQVVYRTVITSNNTNIDLSNQENGIYFVKVNLTSGTEILKVIKQ